MYRTWKFTDVEFFVMWRDLKESTVPWPLSFTSRTPLYDDFMRELAGTRDGLRDKVNGSFGPVLQLMQRPDIRIGLHGWGGTDRQAVEESIRVIAMRQEDRGIVVTQQRGETVMHSAGFTITECAAVELAAKIAVELPAAERGRRADIELPRTAETDEMDYTVGQSAAHDSFATSAAQQAADFLAAPVTRQGTIDVVQGWSRFGPRGITRRRLAWRDLTDDGRYVVNDKNPPIAVAADATLLTKMINARVAAVVHAIRDERR